MSNSRTELENQRTKHQYEKEAMRKDMEKVMKDRMKEMEALNAKLAMKDFNQNSSSSHTMKEYEEIIGNLKNQNLLLREENSMMKRLESERERETEEYKRDIEHKVQMIKSQFQSEISR